MSNNFSTFQIGTWNPATDTWTLLYDLNQPTTGPVWIMNKYPQWTAGEKYDSRSTSIRAVGERIVETSFKNGHWKLKISIRGTTTDAIAVVVRQITQALEQQQLCIRYAAPGSSKYLYFDVRKTTHNLHQAMAQQIIAGIQSGNIDFECYPLARGDRLTCDNLIFNPGFEAPSGPAVVVFSDTFATTNAYTVSSGSAAVAANVMTLTAGTFLLFGSPVWGPINTWQIRWKWVTGLTAFFYIHFVDNNDQLYVQMTGTNLTVTHIAAGVTSNIYVSGTLALTNGNFYWLQMTQFPTAPGSSTTMAVTLSNDSAGSIGSSVLATGDFSTQASSAGLTGKMGLQASGASLAVGGAFSSVNLVELFGPGAWGWIGLQNSATGPGFGAWDQNIANTYPGGPVTSYGAARMDVGPAGTIDCQWQSITAAGAVGPPSMAVTSGDIVNASAWMKSSGMSGTAHAQLVLAEYNASGSFLRQTATDVLANTLNVWDQLTIQVTTGASTAYVVVAARLFDTTAAASSGATLWIDNTQCWDEMTTGMQSMPYCELRFLQSPAQLVISGIQGDQPAPILMAFGTYVSTLNTGQSLTFGIGRKATTGAKALLTSYALAVPGVSMVLSSSAYGGFYVTENGTMGSFIFPARGIISPMPDTQGIYHLLTLQQTQESGYFDVFVQLVSGEQDPAFANTKLSQYQGALLTPFTNFNIWQPCDLGLLSIPNFSLTATSPQNLFTWGTNVSVKDVAGTSAELVGWHLLLPYDAETLLGTILNPSGYSNLSNKWLWFFNDALILSQRTTYPQAWQIQAIGTTLAVPNTPQPYPQYAVGGAGTTTGSFIALNPTGSSFLRVDPTQTTPNSGGLGVNQYGAFITDNNGTVLPFVSSVQYSPYFLYQR